MMISSGKRSLRLINSPDELTDSFSMLAEYQAMPAGYPPYQMLSGPKNYKSAAVTTDSKGYRYSLNGGIVEPIDASYGRDRVNILVGGSTAFGVGATDDAATLSSCLHRESGENWVNLGIRGAVSLQEYIALIQVITNFKSVSKIFFLSGINDLYRNLSDSNASDYDKRFGFENELLSHYSPRRIAFCYVKSIVLGKSINELLSGENEVENAFDVAESFRKFLNQYLRNFQLYSALAKQFECEVTFGFQPFFHYAKSKGTGREEDAIRRSELMQVGTNWEEVRIRITNSIEEASACLRAQAQSNNISYIDFNESFDKDEDFFVDSVHLTNTGYTRISEIFCGIR